MGADGEVTGRVDECRGATQRRWLAERGRERRLVVGGRWSLPCWSLFRPRSQCVKRTTRSRQGAGHEPPTPGRALPSATRCPASHGAGLRLAAPGLPEPSPRPPGGFPRTLSWPCPQAARRRSGHVCWDASLRPGPGSTARAGSPSSRVSGRCRVTVTVTSPARGARSTAACSSRL